MPNWFHNKLKFTGEDAEIKKAKTFIASEKGVLDLNKIKPIPVALEADCTNGRDWRIENWGTTHSVFYSEIDTEDENIIHFDSANAPAMDALIELSRLFPQLTLTVKYYDPLSYQGGFSVNGGEISDFIKELSLSQ